ncbi:PP2C family serine/threonine-protein phosphatase [Legionella birminghamensis]|nr:PP2C family serine/threonine-protein phosphatase [Legionella birminghamensis]STX32923.1 Protein phosphatase 2C [Legionella birminghamensis]
MVKIFQSGIISKPTSNSQAQDKENGFAVDEIQGERLEQEDTSISEVYDPLGVQNLNPLQIAQRLWTSYRLINQEVHNEMDYSGTTAVTTIFKQDFLISALTGDAAVFAAVLNERGILVSLCRLNERTHKPDEENEYNRIIEAGSSVVNNRVQERLAISRAIGDKDVKGVIADPDVMITYLGDIPMEYTVLVISSCDGFTDAAETTNQKIFKEVTDDDFEFGSKRHHELWLFICLYYFMDDRPGALTPLEIASKLTRLAIQHGSMDNVSVSVQIAKRAVEPASFCGMNGIYDGHGGSGASHYTADNMGDMLRWQLEMSEMEYTAQLHSVHTQKQAFLRDNEEISKGQIFNLCTGEYEYIKYLYKAESLVNISSLREALFWHTEEDNASHIPATDINKEQPPF